MRTFKHLGEFKPRQWSDSALRDRYFVFFLLGWFLPLIMVVIFVALNYSRLPYDIPLFYSRLWGGKQVARNIYIYLPCAGAFLLGLFNVGFATSAHGKDRVLAYLLMGGAALVSILAAITTFNIVNLVG